MSVHISEVRWRLDIEGAAESKAVLTGMISDISTVTGLVTSADYAMIAWKRTTEEFNIMNFTRMVMATISLLRNIIAITELATAAQWAYNVALAVGQALHPVGWVALGAGLAYGAHQYLTRPAPAEPYSLAEIMEERERKERERYAASMPG